MICVVYNQFVVWQLMLFHLLDVVVKVAIIGGGISGIGSSATLTQKNVEHIIIEGRDRIGGRITSKMFDGVKIQLGAAFIHHVNKGNRISEMIKELGWNFTEINTGTSYFSYEDTGLLNSSTTDSGYGLYDQLCTDVVAKQANSTTALNLKKAQGNYFKKVENHTAAEVDAGRWFYYLMSNYNGAKMTDLGTEQCQGTISKGDFLPEKGYSSLIDHMYAELKPKAVYLNQQVVKIDYSGPLVKIYTKDSVYSAEKVISSLPLGVLQKKSVQFVPQLPKSQTDAFQDLGNGIYNKVFVSFEQAFWDTTVEWVDFITKDNKDNKYPAARSVIKQGRFILCFFVSSENSIKISKFTNQQLRADFLSFLKRFYPNKEFKIRQILATSWHEDPFSLGSYTYKRVGKNATLAAEQICATVDNKIWFIGEHCHPKLFSYSHGGFETGVWAAQNITKLLV